LQTDLRSEVRRGISSSATCSDLSALKRLAEDLCSGAWERQHADIHEKDELDMGYRLALEFGNESNLRTAVLRG
jgi:hypothetical protein